MSIGWKRGILIMSILAAGALVIFFRIPNIRVPQKEDSGEVPQTATPGKTDSQPDQSAFYRTYGIDDPAKKIAALDKFLSDFPKSSYIGSAKREIFRATVKLWPQDRKKVFDAANSLMATSNGPVRDNWAQGSDYHFLAREMLTAGIFIDEAEEFASQGLAGFTEDRFVANQKKLAKEQGKDAPANEILHKKYIAELAAVRTTLGRIYLRKGRMAEGENILKEAYAVNPLISDAAIGLAEIAEKKGDTSAAIEYLASATLTAGWAITEVRNRFEDFYRKTQQGSLEGMEPLLDAKHRKLFPNPMNLEPYKPTALRSKRVVLAEFFTGAG